MLVAKLYVRALDVKEPGTMWEAEMMAGSRREKLLPGQVQKLYFWDIIILTDQRYLGV
jgi:hypothetical protein